MKNIVYKSDLIPAIDKVLYLYNDVGWTSYTKDKEVLEKAIKNSLKVWTVWDGDELIGLARVVGDGVSIVYIQDILILASYQGLGIGSRLLEIILDEYKLVRQILLLTDNSSKNIEFYKNNGLRNVSDYNCLAFMK
ncbi:GNAT family N-acetyltransferase [Anaerococcus sp. ENR1011]|uniref:GNAT family N-acetyltransferase n=1 Tax=Anaerococcus groningensis TaxID=3115616 RepID=A0ABW9N111_9FIRM